MSSAVDHFVCVQSMRKVCVCTGIAEGKLQDCHPRNVVAITQGDYVRGDEAEVFGKKRQAA